MNEVKNVRRSVSSINVVEPPPQLTIKLATTDVDSPTIVVDGLTPPQAMQIDWGIVTDVIIKGLGDLLDKGGGGGGDGCTIIKITNPNGSTTEIKQCPAPK